MVVWLIQSITAYDCSCATGFVAMEGMEATLKRQHYIKCNITFNLQ